KALLQLLISFSLLGLSILLVVTSSGVGVIRAIRRRRRGGRSVAAVVLAAFANIITTAWLIYWLAHDVHDRSNPINALLVLNLAICALPLMWLIASIRANRARPSELVSQ